MNDENLIPFSVREAREIKRLGAKGGKISGKKRNEKKSMREMFSILLESEAKDREDIKKLKKYGEEKSNQMLMAVSMFELVKEKGNKSVEAFKEIMELIGEKEKQDSLEDKSFKNLIGAIKYARETKSKTE